MRRPPEPRTCANPRCREPLPPFGWRLCPSCRLAGSWASVVTFVVVLVCEGAWALVQWWTR